jgi:hypothetical protein
VSAEEDATAYPQAKERPVNGFVRASLWAIGAFAVGSCAILCADPVPKAALAVTKDGYLKTGFDVLGSFEFNSPDNDAPPVSPAAVKASMAQVPDRIKKLDGKRVMVTGYMLPLKMEGNRVTDFLLVSSPMLCCYGVVPRMNDWIVVKVPSPGTSVLMDSPIQFYGRLHVHEMVQDGMMSGIYLLDGERMGDGSE